MLPKKDRFTIGVECEKTTLDILKKMYEANSVYGQNRLCALHSIDTKLKILQTLIRALFDIKVINDKRFLLFAEQLIEIGKMLGGWIKATKRDCSK